MRLLHESLLCLVLFGLGCGCAGAEGTDQPAPEPVAKIRFAGIFIKGLNVRRIETLECADLKRTATPWMKLDCGVLTCPKTARLGMPLRPNYTNIEKSPRMTEIHVPAGQPLSFNVNGMYQELTHFSVNGSSGTVSSCNFNVSFVPQADRMYEASLDPENRECRLQLSEIAATTSGFERKPIEAVVVRSCPK